MSATLQSAIRLLQCSKEGIFTLTKFEPGTKLNYAILSHTWGHREDEVTCTDIISDSGSDKIGYQKLKFCAAQAKIDHIRYFWIDSACIDRSSATELSEAINSMYDWYRDAKKCYVYLSDVSSSLGFEDFKSSFLNCRWTTRGWTVQELLGPTTVEFFSSEGKLLGDKANLLDLLHEATDIPKAALLDPLGIAIHQKGESVMGE